MYSARTLNTECTNSQNVRRHFATFPSVEVTHCPKPYGFHLADGALLTYLSGNEYEDIAAAWDWNLIPGTTTDYNNTALTCGKAKWTGREAFVGGVSTGSLGAAAMRYSNPYTKALSWQKAFFFLEENTQLVMVGSLASSSKAPVFTVLDQRRYAGSVYSSENSSSSLWHGGVGYLLASSPNSSAFGMRTGPSTENWSAIGISSQPAQTVDLFAAWIEHKIISAALAYFIFPATDLLTFQAKSASRAKAVLTVKNDAHVSAVYDTAHRLFAAVFWDVAGGSAVFKDAMLGSVTVSSSSGAALVFSVGNKTVTVSDPTQSLATMTISVTISDVKQLLTFTLPENGMAGSSVIGRLK
jgi:hypothetical protein